MKIIRWWGLAAFIILGVLLVLIWYLLAPKLIANAIEDIGSEAVGAKVEVRDVELNLFPLSVALNHLTAADPDEPMQNLFESQKIKFSIDSETLLWKKVVIDELAVTGVKTGTPRTSSGALPGGRKTTQMVQEVTDFNVPEVTQEDIQAMVEKADLITLKRVKKLDETQSNIKQEWDTALDKDAFQARVNKLQSEYERLAKRLEENKLNLIKDRNDWKQLKKDVDAERKSISALSDKLKQDKQLISEQIKSVKEGPKDDLNAVMSRFGLGNGVEGLVDKYIGPQYTPWILRALDLVKSFKKSSDVEKTEEEKAAVQVGDKVYFKDEKIFPQLLVKKINIQGENQGISLSGQGFNLGYLPWLIGQPSQLKLDFNGKGSAKVNLKSDWQSANSMQTQLTSNINNWSLESMQFMQTKEGSWLLNSGTLNAQLNGNITLKEIDFSATFEIASPKLDVPQNISDWQQTLANSINNEKSIKLVLTATGALESPKIRVSSGIENLFKQAIGEKVKQKAEKLKGKVKDKIAEKVGDLGDLDKLSGDFSKWQEQISNKDDVLKNILGKIKL